MASRTFLLLVSFATALIVALPYYAKAFYPKAPAQSVAAGEGSHTRTVSFSIRGMTCAGCEGQVNGELAKLPGVIHSVTSYAKRNSVVRFDEAKTTVQQLKAAIDKTGYTVVATQTDSHGSSD